MGAGVSIDTSRLEVTPGSTATMQITVRNTGAVVDLFTVDVVGDGAAYATVSPPTLSLFPGGDGKTMIVFSPPRDSSVGHGDVPIGVRVRSQEDPTGSVTEEATLAVQPFSEVSAELVPAASQGTGSATHQVAIDNRGNAEAQVNVSAADPNQVLQFSVTPPGVVAGPDTASFIDVEVRSSKRFLRGNPVHHQFQVFVEQEGRPPIQLNGTMVQRPRLPRWFGKAVAGVLIALLALLLLWFLVLKPTIKSAAEDAVKEDKAKSAAGISNDGGGGSGGSSASTVVSPTTIPGTGGAGTQQPIDGRLFLTDKGEVSFTVPDGKVLQLTDIVLQNPGGETGRLQIRREGTALLVVELTNFRDLDYHFVSPIVFGAGQKLVLAADCTSPTCTPGAYFSGYLIDAAG
ncbi:MAG: COG1470 family protein [Acidimicrobiales bacterium]